MLITNLAPQLTSSAPSEPDTSSLESDLPFYRKLGRTDLTVSGLGIGGGGSLSSEDTIYAFEQGINYFFYSSDLHHHAYSAMAEGLRQLCGRSSALREQVVLATVTYIKHPDMAMTGLFDQFRELNLDYIDVFFWGWIENNDAPALNQCLKLSPDLRGANSPYQRTMERLFGATERLKKMGAVRYVGASFHDLNLAKQWLDSSLIDVAMVRHNVSHRSAQEAIFNQPQINHSQRPGIVTFKTTSSRTGNPLWVAPKSLPKACWHPSVPDLYRYSLSQNCVDVCLMGLQRRTEIDAAIAGLQQGKLTRAEMEYLSFYGDLHRDRIQFQDIPSEKLIDRS